jgi:hypothetical protein
LRLPLPRNKAGRLVRRRHVFQLNLRRRRCGTDYAKAHRGWGRRSSSEPWSDHIDQHERVWR